MDLLADVGNSRVHLARFEGGRLLDTLATPHAEGAAAWDAFCAGRVPDRLAAVSVRGARLDDYRAWARSRFGREPRVLCQDLPAGIPLRVAQPGQVGEDRVANAIWAGREHPGQTVVVVDLGTAVTFDVVGPDGAFLGGAIAPGLATGAWALHERTAGRLPQVTITSRPPALCRDTETCLRAGLYYGLAGLVDALCAQLEAELETPLHVVATGGDAELIAPASARIAAVVPALTLHGLWYALEAADA